MGMHATLVIGGMVPAYEEPYLDACAKVERAQKEHWQAAVNDESTLEEVNAALAAAKRTHLWPDIEAFQAKHPGSVPYVPISERPGWTVLEVPPSATADAYRRPKGEPVQTVEGGGLAEGGLT